MYVYVPNEPCNNLIRTKEVFTLENRRNRLESSRVTRLISGLIPWWLLKPELVLIRNGTWNQAKIRVKLSIQLTQTDRVSTSE